MTLPNILTNSATNKDTAFTYEERISLNLLGKLPPKIETIEEQCKRSYAQYQELPNNLAKYIYLNELHNRNETLFYRLVGEYLAEMMPIVYTPTVGEAIQKFSHIYQSHRGLIISYENKDHFEKIFADYSSTDIDMIVVSDAEGILGIGDQGVGGIYICIGKLAVYTLCGDINPNRVLPIQLDVGTNNEKMLNDPMYLGWRHERIHGQEYDDFIDIFVKGVRKKFPNIFLHWEDFGRDTARRNLERYQNEMCTFNDDMQGTAVITLAAVLSALVVTGQKISEQRIIFHGAGTSASGIAERICAAMVKQGLSMEEARAKIWMLGRHGLLMPDSPKTAPFQEAYMRSEAEIATWELTDKNNIDLLTVVKNVKPTILIGCSTVGGAFTEEIVKTMTKHIERPIILPLSNPTSNSEADPADVAKWSNNKALVATGSPFPNTAQCNNAFAFPGIGLGIIAVKARRVTDNMLDAACQAITASSPVEQLLPALENVKQVSYNVAVAVAKQAIADGVADQVDAEQAIKDTMWEAKYSEPEPGLH
jgi:malate dehydrogenase (oxaloacetate-decarboxylating)